jgi:hypothetical protein
MAEKVNQNGVSSSSLGGTGGGVSLPPPKVFSLLSRVIIPEKGLS